MLGKLATYLRMCGYDAAYVLDDGPDPGDDAVLGRAREEGRTLVTRDERLAARADGGILLASKSVTDQLAEFAAAGYSPSLDDRPTRCGSCNGSVARVDAGESVPEYAPDPDERPLWRCRDCGQVFWKGSHWTDVAARLDSVR
ncbi:Mut7-C RNAse domain-containing protein [Halogeometricum sp. S3BR5-2]|uniref:Mut7-C RNAse domain-containing protein n=2 Tax=Halogeometricum luteum TaxID=2950537 RepID=A0ABU2FYI2_9EURY|nr:Mut7-C RNAse domain-containing protein [Halogeometricum sp. S3BR5-2]